MRTLILALAMFGLMAVDSAGSWGAGCARGQFGTVGPSVRIVRTSKSKAAKSKAAKKDKKPVQACPNRCGCACNDYGECNCFGGEHCGCRSCDCGLTGAAKQAVAEQRAEDRDIKNFGLQREKLHKGPRYSINGKPVPRDRVIEKLKENGREGPPLTDDSAKLPITLVGDGRDAVAKDIREHAAFAAIRDQLLLQSYAPDNWAVNRYGFKTDGKPTIYVQDRDGRVLLRRDDYSGGPELLARQVADVTQHARLRRKDPDYDGKRDPDGRRPVLPAGLPVPWPVAVVGLGVVGLGVSRYLANQRKG